MGITDIDKIYEANELASGENVVFAGSGITDGLLSVSYTHLTLPTNREV